VRAETLRRRLVRQLRTQGLSSRPIADAFLAVPREVFVQDVLAERGLEFVYSDQALLVKRDAQGRPLSSSSQPAIMAQMLELLELEPGHRVLEIGAGTGYNAALMSHLVGEQGRVVTLDIDPQLASRARTAIKRSGHRATVVAADGRAGSPKHAPFDGIIVTACADQIELAWFEQLREGGRIVLPLRLDGDPDALQLIPAFKRNGRQLDSAGLTWGGFMPVHSGDGGWGPPAAFLGASLQRRGRHHSLISVSGDGLLKLRPRAARALLAELLDRDRRPLRTGFTPLAGGHTPLIVAYLLTRIPRRHRVWIRAEARHGIGLVDARSRSAALLTVPDTWVPTANPPRSRIAWHLHAFGKNDTAAQNLIALTSEFGRLRNPEPSITAKPARHGMRLSASWST
jgi:protein-L-isoaspartate(D-aspartate) O-methyltransferase